jgi:transketolase
MEQIRNDMNYMNLPVAIVALGEGFSYGSAGYSHHLVEDIGALRSLASVSIFSPTHSKEISVSLKKILASRSPSVIRLGKKPVMGALEINVEGNFCGFTRQRLGDKNLMVFHGGLLDVVHTAGKILTDQKISPSIYSCFNFDRDSIDIFLQSHPESSILIVEEHVLAGGLGTIFLESANELGWQGKIKRLGVSQIDVQAVGSQEFLRQVYGLDPQTISDSFIQLLGNNA